MKKKSMIKKESSLINKPFLNNYKDLKEKDLLPKPQKNFNKSEPRKKKINKNLKINS